MKRPRLLIVTQAVDPNDSALGFFLEWIRALAEGDRDVEIWCLRYDPSTTLPANVRVRPLPSGRAARIAAFLGRAVTTRFDAVFVHMSPIWAALGGPLWRIIGSRVVLWYTHGSSSVPLRIAAIFANTIVTATPGAFPIKSSKIQAIGHGISPQYSDVRRPPMADVGRPHILAVGRVTERKRVIETLEFFARIKKSRPNARLTWIGEPLTDADRVYAQKVRGRAAEFGIVADVSWEGKMPFVELPEIYADANLLLHLSATGSLDKVILESLASGCPVFSTNPATKEAVPSAYWDGELNDAAANEALRRIDAGMSDEARRDIGGRFSLDALTKKLLHSMELDETQEPSRSDRRFSRKLFLVAAAVRLGLLAVMLFAIGETALHFSDTAHYVGLAESLLSGHGFALDGIPFIYRTPGYPLIVAASLAIFKSIIPLSILQILLSAFIPFLVFLIGRELGLRRPVARVAAWITVIEPHLVFYALPIMTDMIFTVLFLSFLLVFLRLIKNPTIRHSLLAGLLFGVGLIIKPFFQLFWPVIAGVMLWTAIKRKGIASAVLIVATFMLVAFALVAPWMARNHRVFGSFTLSTQGGAAFSGYLIPGIISVRDGISVSEAEDRRDAYLLETYGITKEEQASPGASSVLSKDSLRIIRENPGTTASVLVTNTFSFWTSHTYGYLLKRYHVLPDPPSDIVPPSHLLARGDYGEFVRAFARTIAQPFWLAVMLGRILWAAIFVLFLIGLARRLWMRENRVPHVFILLLCGYSTAVLWVNGLGIDARLRLALMPLTILYAVDAMNMTRTWRWSSFADAMFVLGRRIRAWHRSAPMRTWLIVVSFLAVVVYAFSYRIPPHVDARRYHNVASHLVTLGTFCETCDVPLPKDTAIHGVGPGYQFFLAGIYKLFGIRTWVVWIIHAVMHATVVLWLWSLLERLVGRDALRRKLTIAPLALYAVHPDVIQLGAMLMTETFFVFMLMACVKIFLPFIERDLTPRSWVMRGAAFGAMLGALTMVRPTGVPIFICALALLLWRRRFTVAIAAIVLFVGIQVPWAIRNNQIYDKFVFNSVVGGLDVWAGLHPATGGEFNFEKAPEVEAAIKDLDADEIDALSLAESKKIIAERPGYAVLRTIHKGFKLFALTKTSAFWFHYRSVVDQLATFVGSVGFNFILWVMAFAALEFAVWRRRLPPPIVMLSMALIMLLAISPILTVITGRYRVPMLPFAAILGAWWLVEAKGKERWRSALFGVLFLVVATASDLWGSFYKVGEHVKQLFD